jgi:hypothetical protein
VMAPAALAIQKRLLSRSTARMSLEELQTGRRPPSQARKLQRFLLIRDTSTPHHARM